MTEPPAGPVAHDGHAVPLSTIAREWSRLGAIGFGGPPAHIALLRQLCVVDRRWQTDREFEDAVAVTNLLPGPASTQLAILSAWRLRGPLGAIVGGVCFIVPGLVMILALSVLFFASSPPIVVLAAAAGVGAAVPAVAIQAAAGLAPASWKRNGGRRPSQVRWVLYAVAGAAAATLLGPFLVVVLGVCGIVEVVAHRPRTVPPRMLSVTPAVVLPAAGTLAAVSWVAFKVGALSYGGGFVIIPLMQHDAVAVHHWMTNAQFLDAVALGQVTPGPVVLTVSAVGYAAAGIVGGLLAAVVAFAPSFVYVIGGAPHLEKLRSNRSIQAFLTGAGAAAIGAIAGASLTLGLALDHSWQALPLAVGAGWLFVARRSVVTALLGAGIIGMGAGLLGLPVGR